MKAFFKDTLLALLLLMGAWNLSASERLDGCCKSRLIAHPCKNLPNEVCLGLIPCNQCISPFCMNGTTSERNSCCDMAECRLMQGCRCNDGCQENNFDNWNAATTRFAARHGMNANKVWLVLEQDEYPPTPRTTLHRH